VSDWERELAKARVEYDEAMKEARRPRRIANTLGMLLCFAGSVVFLAAGLMDAAAFGMMLSAIFAAHSRIDRMEAK
jgi:hypothetical protein